MSGNTEGAGPALAAHSLDGDLHTAGIVIGNVLSRR